MNKNFKEIWKDIFGSQFYVYLLQPKPRAGFVHESRDLGILHILVSGETIIGRNVGKLKENSIIVAIPRLDQNFCDNERTAITENFGEILGKF